ncbi:MAG: ribosome silencing factor [Candidatus Izemoplasmatales bacterium]|jgi:ribosome-associated protein|nr:ribosome silencing factor [Acholeplasmataceae bacterium]
MTERLNRVVETLNKLLLMDVRVFDFRGSSPFFDYQVIASGKSERQVHAAIDHLLQAFPKDEIRHIEGRDQSRWLLFDLGEIIVHVLHKDEREYYQFEKLFIGKEVVESNIKDI